LFAAVPCLREALLEVVRELLAALRETEGYARAGEARHGGARMSRKTSLDGEWLKLAQAAGSVGALADALGVAPSSIYRWGMGRPISKLARTAVQRYARRRRLADPTA
jgi:hypothetical protein